MRIIVTLFLLLVLPISAYADYRPTGISWKGWDISTSENLYEGKRQRSYPLTHLFDNDPKTAWVFSGTGKSQDARRSWGSSYALQLRVDKPFTADTLRLMNGYNKSQEVFQRNNRVVTVRITLDNVYVKTATLSDRMGWHTISLPHRKITTLKLECIGIRKGVEDDLCLSELALYNRGEKVRMQMPEAVLFTQGSDCGCGPGGVLLSRDGLTLAKDDLGEGGSATWSPNGVYLTSAEAVKGGYRLWVADVRTGEIQRLRVYPDIYTIAWRDSRTVAVEVPAANQTRTRLIRVP